MSHLPGTCPEPAELSALTLGLLPEAGIARIERHLEDCPDCRRRLEELDRASPGARDTILRLLREHRSQETPVAPADATPAAAGGGRDEAPQEIPPELCGYQPLRFLRRLGKGGMGIVYLAEQVSMGRRVAVKVLNPDLLAENEAGLVRMFEKEVAAVGALSHPNIVAAHDCCAVGGQRLLVLEFIEGRDLQQVVARDGPLPIARACAYVCQALAGLQYAHERGLVHRDLKPSNLMLTAAGQVKVLDFGLARLVEGALRQAAGPGASAGTTLLAGTPGFMAPEQALNPGTADTRADVYSAGCTLFYLLTGRSPFPDRGTVATLQAHCGEPPPPVRSLRPDVPRKLEAVLTAMLARAPADRPATPAAAAALLLPFTREPRRRSRRTGFACAAAALVLLGFVGFALRTDRGAWLILENLPEAAELWVDDDRQEVLVRAGKHRVWVRAGEHTVEVRKAGFATRGERLTVIVGGDRFFDARLVPVGQAGPPPPAPALAKPRAARKPPPRGVILANGGTWQIQRDELVQTTLARRQPMGPALLFGDPDWDDYDFHFEAKVEKGPEGFKALFRAVDASNSYGIGFGSYANIGHDIWLLERGGWQRDNVPTFAFRGGQIDQNAWHRVKISTRGERLEGYLDGTLLFKARNGKYPRGLVGVGTWGTSVRFRNFQVRNPDGTELWNGLPDPTLRIDLEQYRRP